MIVCHYIYISNIYICIEGFWRSFGSVGGAEGGLGAVAAAEITAREVRHQGAEPHAVHEGQADPGGDGADQGLDHYEDAWYNFGMLKSYRFI